MELDDDYIVAQRAEELCSILLEEDTPSLEWFTRLKEQISEQDALSTPGLYSENYRGFVGSEPLLPKVIGLLHECLLNWRWSEALIILRKLIRTPKGVCTSLWKAGSEVLSLECEGNRDLVQQLFMKMRCASDVNCREIILQYVVYLLTIHETEAITVLQDPVIRYGPRTERQKQDQLFETLNTAYTGLLCYIEWKKCKKLIKELSEGGDYGPSTQTRVWNAEMQVNNFSTKACKCFSALEGLEGIWDIFITKHVEMLVAVEKVEAAETLLQQYCDKNPDNLNAHKYLYKFHTTCSSNRHAAVQCLKTIASMSPSDNLVLELVALLWHDDLSEVVEYLFKMLDYPLWQRELKPWKALSKCLQKLLNKRSAEPTVVATVKQCWTVRRSWWPAFHFTKYHIISCLDVPALNVHKLTIAAALDGKESDFVVRCCTHLSEEERNAVILAVDKLVSLQ